jgi:hypothetical protein
MARYPLAIKISNVLVYFLLLGSNIYSGLDPDNNESPYGDKHLTYISPAPFVFGVWGIIHFLLGGFVIYQWFGNQDLILDGINWHFVSISLLNLLWLALWQTDHLILAWITILFTSVQISLIYKILKQSRDDHNINELIWIHAPFSLYHAWIVVISFISIFAAFAPKEEGSKPSIIVKIFAVIALLLLAKLATIGYVYKSKGDVAGALVIAWTLYGIAVEQEDPVIHWTALVLAIISSIAIVVPIVRKFFHRNSGETAPLLG